MDHNFKTAYFVISENAKHGEDLVSRRTCCGPPVRRKDDDIDLSLMDLFRLVFHQVCSYFACRNGGVKFRYCAYCMAPVAKRNFCRRHDHDVSGVDGVGDLKDSDDEEEDLDASDRTAEKAGGKMCMPVGPSNRGLQSGGTQDDGHRDSNANGRKRKTNVGSVSSKRRHLWSNLLARRPRTKDPRNLSSWLNEVLTVSDLEFPVDMNAMPVGMSETESEASQPKGTAESEGGAAGESVSRVKDAEKKGSDGGEDSAAGSKNDEKVPNDDATSQAAFQENEDGFVGSFADWRVRKKSSKKNATSLNSDVRAD